MITTSDDILGKEAVDPEGHILGIVVKLHIDRKSKEIMGITIDQGFIKSDLYIGIDLVSRFGIDAVFLKRIPYDKYKSIPVITYQGEEIGKVQDIKLFRGKIQEVTARKQIYKRDTFIIPAKHIATIGDSLVLKKGFAEKKQNTKSSEKAEQETEHS